MLELTEKSSEIIHLENKEATLAWNPNSDACCFFGGLLIIDSVIYWSNNYFFGSRILPLVGTDLTRQQLADAGITGAYAWFPVSACCKISFCANGTEMEYQISKNPQLVDSMCLRFQRRYLIADYKIRCANDRSVLFAATLISRGAAEGAIASVLGAAVTGVLTVETLPVLAAAGAVGAAVPTAILTTGLVMYRAYKDRQLKCCIDSDLFKPISCCNYSESANMTGAPPAQDMDRTSATVENNLAAPLLT